VRRPSPSPQRSAADSPRADDDEAGPGGRSAACLAAAAPAPCSSSALSVPTTIYVPMANGVSSRATIGAPASSKHTPTVASAAALPGLGDFCAALVKNSRSSTAVAASSGASLASSSNAASPAAGEPAPRPLSARATLGGPLTVGQRWRFETAVGVAASPQGVAPQQSGPLWHWAPPSPIAAHTFRQQPPFYPAAPGILVAPAPGAASPCMARASPRRASQIAQAGLGHPVTSAPGIGVAGAGIANCGAFRGSPRRLERGVAGACGGLRSRSCERRRFLV